MSEKKSLTGTLQILESETDGVHVTFGEIVEALNHRGFGALLMAPSVLTILPTGAIPGVPVFNAVFICLIGGQIIAGRHYPWIPKKIKNFSFKRKRLISVIDKAKPYTKIIDGFVRPRLSILSQKSFHPVIAFICCILAITMGVIGFIPFLPALISIPILFFALGMSARDGVMVLCGFAFTFAAALLILWLSGFMGNEARITISKPVFVEQTPYFIDHGFFQSFVD